MYAHGSERRTRVFIPIFAGQNVIDLVSRRRWIARKFGAEQTKFHTWRVRPLATGDISVTAVQFTDQLAEQVGEIVSMIHERDKRCVFVAHRFPIDAVHGWGEKEIAHVPPAFEIDLV